MARDLVAECVAEGIKTEIMTLDALVKAEEGNPLKIATRLASQPVMITTPSYNGFPPDNAAKWKTFVTETLPASTAEDAAVASAMQDVDFAVFGTGNTAWALTYQCYPSLVERALTSASTSTPSR